MPNDLHTPAEIPGIFDLIRFGTALYKERLKTVLVLLLIQIAAGVFFGAAIVASALSTIAFGVSGMLFVALSVLAFIYGALWLEVAFLRAFSDPVEFMTVRGLFARSRSQIFPFLWVSFLVLCAMLAAVALVAAFGLVGAFLFGKGVVVAEVILGALIAIGASVFIATRLVFANWIVVRDRARGFAALHESMRLTRGIFWPVFGRFFGLSFIMGGLTFLLQLFAVLLLGRYGSMLSQLISMLVFTPVFVAATWLLYRSVATETPPDAQP